MSKKGTARLYDKDFNLLASWPTDATVYFVADYEDGHRQSGPVSEVRFEAEP